MKKPKLEGTMQYTAIDYSASTHEWNITMTGSDWPWMMKLAKPSIRCPDCKTVDIHVHSNYIKGGKRYECLNSNCETVTFIIK